MSKKPRQPAVTKSIQGTVMHKVHSKIMVLGADFRIYSYEIAPAYKHIVEGTLLSLYYLEPELNNTQVCGLDIIRLPEFADEDFTSEESSDL